MPSNCHDPNHPSYDPNIFAPPEAIKCQCDGCGGTLRADGRNKMDTLTFLICSECACCYRAEDKQVKG